MEVDELMSDQRRDFTLLHNRVSFPVAEFRGWYIRRACKHFRPDQQAIARSRSRETDFTYEKISIREKGLRIEFFEFAKRPYRFRPLSINTGAERPNCFKEIRRTLDRLCQPFRADPTTSVEVLQAWSAAVNIFSLKNRCPVFGRHTHCLVISQPKATYVGCDKARFIWIAVILYELHLLVIACSNSLCPSRIIVQRIQIAIGFQMRCAVIACLNGAE